MSFELLSGAEVVDQQVLINNQVHAKRTSSVPDGPETGVFHISPDSWTCLRVIHLAIVCLADRQFTHTVPATSSVILTQCDL